MTTTRRECIIKYSDQNNKDRDNIPNDLWNFRLNSYVKFSQVSPKET